MIRNIILISITVVFFLSFTITKMFFFSGKSDKIMDLQQQQKKINEKYITAQILSQDLKHVYSLFEHNLALNKNDLKNQEASIDFLKELTQLTNELDIITNKIHPKPKLKGGKHTIIPYNLEIRCDYEKLGKFLSELENNERLIIVNDFIFENSLERVTNQGMLEKLPEQDIEMTISTVTLNKAAR